jgi:hypothetical protein
MRDAREYVNPGDLVAVNTKYKLQAGICKAWTDDTFQYFSIGDYQNRQYPSSITSPKDVKDYVKDTYFLTWTDYIRVRVELRVISIKDDYLNEFEKAYYDALKEELNL